ncbi:hypothetical protein WN944_006863 [Citrus x changshan-huyou]|uniref:Reverse transcriptase domain-containing protein n=1 Tax=Citrus x changshan-huyou TaxID=2935761 RepID=A0AAP0MJY3_9ROSI
MDKLEKATAIVDRILEAATWEVKLNDMPDLAFGYESVFVLYGRFMNRDTTSRNYATMNRRCVGHFIELDELRHLSSSQLKDFSILKEGLGRVVLCHHTSLLHGLKFSRDLSISHLLFADDSLIFTKATEEDCKNLKKLFECYEKASGQIFNMEKSSMFFSSSTKPEQVAVIKQNFQLNVVSKHEKYLGLPSMIGRRTKSFFNEIKLKVLSKITS